MSFVSDCMHYCSYIAQIVVQANALISFFLCHSTLPVVYHHGNSATGGHYTTDVFHIGLNGWLRIDDQAVKVIHQYQVVKQTAERTAYLLYYRRVDLL